MKRDREKNVESTPLDPELCLKYYQMNSSILHAYKINMAMYSNEKSYEIEGYIIFDKFGHFLNENFRWQNLNTYRKCYVHCMDAIPHIAKIFKQNEVAPEYVIKAKHMRMIGADIIDFDPIPFASIIN